ncbi:zinc finger protein ZFP69B [Eurytemora carolleeae]|uniref:zinc finger protein ZFP69B n=1 Tax=Eurytemora carolleeae TaxID=1294199 RepID=UPI000C7786A2|nr:zinc finger protein ZFP69B [Eurytemora carolleeae]|eukprot:XP_023332779.1 zinc finger protein ZFP69B-like [Eurytemora affinis]
MNGTSPAVLGEDKKEKSPVSTPGTHTNMVKVETSPVSIPASVSEELIPGKRRRVPPKKLYEEINRTNEKKRVCRKRIGKCQRCGVSWESLNHKRSHLRNKAKCKILDYICICSHCNGKFRDEKDVMRHLKDRRVRSAQTVTYKCKTCSKVYSLLADMEEHLRTKNKDLETKRDKEMTSFPQTELPEVNSKLEVVKENTLIDDVFRQPFQVYSLQNVQVYSLIKLETANAVMMGNQDTLSLGEVKKRKYSERREKCQYCELTLETLSEKNEHLANQESCKQLEYFCICKHCNKAFRDEKDVKIHWRMKKASINCYIEFKCKTCRQSRCFQV